MLFCHIRSTDFVGEKKTPHPPPWRLPGRPCCSSLQPPRSWDIEVGASWRHWGPWQPFEPLKIHHFFGHVLGVYPLINVYDYIYEPLKIHWLIECEKGDYILPGLLGIMIAHSRETYQPTSIMGWDRGILNGSFSSRILQPRLSTGGEWVSVGNIGSFITWIVSIGSIWAYLWWVTVHNTTFIAG